jgi:CubicO group peptidase (beta-lactamase class C family)
MEIGGSGNGSYSSFVFYCTLLRRIDLNDGLEFKGLVVKNSDNTTTPPATPMTMAQLVSHSAGFPRQLTVASDTLDNIIPPLVKGNLDFQPGKDWKYGPGVELQGYLVQRWASGASTSADKANITKDLSDYLQETIFKPLGMSDTGFFIDSSKAIRVPKVHARTSDTIIPTIDRVAIAKPKRLSPSGGLMSTAEDYFKFCQMLLNGGELNGKRVLKESSVKLMHTNVLEPGVRVKVGAASTGEGLGFGVDFAIIREQKAANTSVPEESFYWGGACKLISHKG